MLLKSNLFPVWEQCDGHVYLCVFVYSIDICRCVCTADGVESGSFFHRSDLRRKKQKKIKGRETFLSVSNLSCDACWVLFHLLFRKIEKKKKNNVKVL